MLPIGKLSWTQLIRKSVKRVVFEKIFLGCVQNGIDEFCPGCPDN